MRDITLLAAVALQIRARVSGLFRSSGPLAVFGAIWSFVVYSLKGEVGWARSHVGVKLLERIQPRLANADSSPAPVRPVWIVWIATALLHVLPRKPLWKNLAFCGHSMNETAWVFRPKATATGTCAVPERRAIDRFYGTARASAEPFPRREITQRRPSSKLLLCDVYECRHISSRCVNA
jgi:hypothetical protein